jgi:hypothetical protein
MFIRKSLFIRAGWCVWCAPRDLERHDDGAAGGGGAASSYRQGAIGDSILADSEGIIVTSTPHLTKQRAMSLVGGSESVHSKAAGLRLITSRCHVHMTAAPGPRHWVRLMCVARVAQQLDYSSGIPYLMLTPNPALRRGCAASSYYVDRCSGALRASCSMLSE